MVTYIGLDETKRLLDYLQVHNNQVITVVQYFYLIPFWVASTYVQSNITTTKTLQ